MGKNVNQCNEEDYITSEAKIIIVPDLTYLYMLIFSETGQLHNDKNRDQAIFGYNNSEQLSCG